MEKDKLMQRLQSLEGHVGLYYKNLVSGETFAYHENDAFEAASLPKLALLLIVLKLAHNGEFSLHPVC